MKIGVWLGEKVSATTGGGASFSERFLQMIDNYQFDNDVEICYVSYIPQVCLHKEIINISQLPTLLYRLVSFSKLLTRLLRRADYQIIIKKGLNRVLNGTGVKIVYYISQGTCVDPNFPFIINNWDIGHRSTHAFPEVTHNKIFEQRDKFYNSILPKSLFTICESETGRQELMDYTNLGKHKIRIMPLFAGGVSSSAITQSAMQEILKRVGLEEFRFFYYPAQFWAHKNHIGLLKAFKIFKTNHPGYKLVFSGADKGNKDYVLNKISEYGLAGDVLLLGFVSEEVVLTLYKNATCLVMASHFGPTNMPPIEAMELGCPVACSDIGGHREILGDSAVYFDSFNAETICNAFVEVISHHKDWLSKIVKQKGVTRFNSDNALSALNSILCEAVNIRENWK